MEGSAKVAEGYASSDESSSLFSGDLGLGFGLKPGGLPKENDSIYPHLELLSLFETPSNLSLSSDTLETPCETLIRKNSFKEKTEQFTKQDTTSRVSKWNLPKRRFSLKLRDKALGESTSIKDEEKCKKEKFPGLRRIKSAKDRRLMLQDDEYHALQSKLFNARQEIENLTLELEACQQQLQSKYGAVKIIQSLSLLEQAQQRCLSRKALEASKKLQQEVNFLQWELELKQSYLLDSEQTWAERFDRVATENAALMVAAQARTDELRKVVIEKMALVRERDELAAALEVRNLIKYDTNTPEREEILSTGDLIIELATLGACQCRGKNQEPCACARAAVDAKRDVRHFKHKLEMAYRRQEEALLTADAYRVAFEQQLAKNSKLIYELLEKSSWRKRFGFCGPTKKMAMKDNDAMCEEKHLFDQIKTHKDDIVKKLVGMLSDNSEALVHQRLATKLLAARMKELENTQAVTSPDKQRKDNT